MINVDINYVLVIFTLWPNLLHVSAVDQALKLEEGDSAVSQTSKLGKPLETVKTQYFIGTEDGEVACFDFKLEKDMDSGKNISKLLYMAASSSVII